AEVQDGEVAPQDGFSPELHLRRRDLPLRPAVVRPWDRPYDPHFLPLVCDVVGDDRFAQVLGCDPRIEPDGMIIEFGDLPECHSVEKLSPAVRHAPLRFLSPAEDGTWPPR